MDVNAWTFLPVHTFQKKPNSSLQYDIHTKCGVCFFNCLVKEKEMHHDTSTYLGALDCLWMLNRLSFESWILYCTRLGSFKKLGKPGNFESSHLKRNMAHTALHPSVMHVKSNLTRDLFFTRKYISLYWSILFSKKLIYYGINCLKK